MTNSLVGSYILISSVAYCEMMNRQCLYRNGSFPHLHVYITFIIMLLSIHARRGKVHFIKYKGSKY